MRALRKTDYVLGRRPTREALQSARDAPVTVSAYLYEGVMRYAGPCTEGSKAGPGVLYRVRVRLKQNAPAD